MHGTVVSDSEVAGDLGRFQERVFELLFTAALLVGRLCRKGLLDLEVLVALLIEYRRDLRVPAAPSEEV